MQLLEGEEYLYELEVNLEGNGGLGVDRPEVFDPDTDCGERGRLRPGLYTGSLPLRFTSGGREIGGCRLEVRSRKLDYLEHYRWMLSDIAREMAELVMQRFAPTEQRFKVQEGLDAATLYQRFAFLRSLIESEIFDGAVQQILHRPYRTWIRQEETRPPGRGIPATSGAVRQLTGPGARVKAGPLEDALRMESVPREIGVGRSEETRDNVPNRFVRFSFERWRDVVAQIHDLLRQMDESGPVERGLRESRELLDRLDALLARELFRTCDPLTSYPASNQVLHRREGYREVFRAYIQFEAAAQLSWKGGEDVYGAGQRDVATLYEYWVFFELAREISDLCDEPFDFGELIEASGNGLGVRLMRGKRRILSGTVRRLGRALQIELWFNRTFSAVGSGTDAESWTRAMRPDCSLRIRAPESTAAFFHDEVWLHFDAKYRVNRLEEALGEVAESPEEEEDVVEKEEEEEAKGKARRTDLLKMHAYRDAIRRSSGAYVIYPGTERSLNCEYHEILPGLGAFALRPTRGDRAEGRSAIRRFIDEVLDQVALQTSQHERARFWTRASYEEEREPDARVESAPFLREPPADARVLLGYVKSEAHYEWIRQEGLYNLRADGRTGSVELGSEELSAPYLLLYGERVPALPELWLIGGEPRLLDRERMLALKYPRQGGKLYFCLPVGPRREYVPLQDVTSKDLIRFHRSETNGRKGEPLVLSWFKLVESVLG